MVKTWKSWTRAQDTYRSSHTHHYRGLLLPSQEDNFQWFCWKRWSSTLVFMGYQILSDAEPYCADTLMGLYPCREGLLPPDFTEMLRWLAVAKGTSAVFNSERVLCRPGCISLIIPWHNTPGKTAVSPAWTVSSTKQGVTRCKAALHTFAVKESQHFSCWKQQIATVLSRKTTDGRNQLEITFPSKKNC